MNIYFLAGATVGILVLASILWLVLDWLFKGKPSWALSIIAVSIVVLGDALISPYGMESQAGVIGGVFAWQRFLTMIPAAAIALAIILVWDRFGASDDEDQ